MKRLSIYFGFSLLLLGSCTKSKYDPAREIRVTQFKAIDGSIRYTYNEAGLVSHSDADSRVETPFSPYPLGTPFKSVNNFEYEGSKVIRANAQITILIPDNPVALKATSFYKWDGQTRLKETYSDNTTKKIQWATDEKGRLTGHIEDNNQWLWSYDKNGNVILPTYDADIKISISYSQHKNPFINGNAGFIQYVSAREYPMGLLKYLSAYLPEKYEWNRAYTMGSGNPTIHVNKSETVTFTYGFDAQGLLNMVIINTKRVNKENGEVKSFEDFIDAYPVTCIRLN